MQHLTYKNGKMWATVLAQLAQGRGGRRRKVARSSGLKEFAAVVLPYRSSCSTCLPLLESRLNCPHETRTHRERDKNSELTCVCVSSVCARRRHVLAQIKSNKGAGKEREGREEGREQAKAADIPRQIKVRNADEKAKKAEESNALHNRKQGRLGKGKRKRKKRQERRQEAGEKGLPWETGSSTSR